MKSLNPREQLRKEKCPSYFCYGTHDLLVFLKWLSNTSAASWEGNKNIFILPITTLLTASKSKVSPS